MGDPLYTDLAYLNGDLAVNAQGDLYTVSGIDNLTAALQRRFETPLGALFYDTTYGNNLYSRLSKPMGQNFEKDVINDVTKAMLADRRVKSVTVQVAIQREQRIVMVNVSFKDINGNTGSFQQGVNMGV